MNIERIFFPGIHCVSRSRGMPSKLLPHEISNWNKSGISEMEKLFSMRETLFSFFTVSLFVVAFGSIVNKYYLAIMISSQLFSLIKKQSLDIIFVDCWLSLTISRSYLCVERYLEKKRTSEITMMKMQVKKMLRRCFLGEISLWFCPSPLFGTFAFIMKGSLTCFRICILHSPCSVKQIRRTCFLQWLSAQSTGAHTGRRRYAGTGSEILRWALSKTEILHWPYSIPGISKW